MYIKFRTLLVVCAVSFSCQLRAVVIPVTPDTGTDTNTDTNTWFQKYCQHLVSVYNSDLNERFLGAVIGRKSIIVPIEYVIAKKGNPPLVYSNTTYFFVYSNITSIEAEESTGVSDISTLPDYPGVALLYLAEELTDKEKEPVARSPVDLMYIIGSDPYTYLFLTKGSKKFHVQANFATLPFDENMDPGDKTFKVITGVKQQLFEVKFEEEEKEKEEGGCTGRELYEGEDTIETKSGWVLHEGGDGIDTLNGVNYIRGAIMFNGLGNLIGLSVDEEILYDSTNKTMIFHIVAKRDYLANGLHGEL